MNAMKHTEGLWDLYSRHRDEQYVDVPIKEPLERGTSHKAVFQIQHKEDIPDDEAEGNAVLVSKAPWYRVLALIAIQADLSNGIRPARKKDKVVGWCVAVGSARWGWSGGVDDFGVPVPPPEKMFMEIKQAIESL